MKQKHRDRNVVMNDAKIFMNDLEDPVTIWTWIDFYKARLAPVNPIQIDGLLPPPPLYYYGCVTMNQANRVYLAALKLRLRQMHPEFENWSSEELELLWPSTDEDNEDSEDTVLETETDSYGEPEYFIGDPDDSIEVPDDSNEEPGYFVEDPDDENGEPDYFAEDPDDVNEEPDYFVKDSDASHEEPDYFAEDPDDENEEPDYFAEDPDDENEEPDYFAEDPDDENEEPDYFAEDPDDENEEPDYFVKNSDDSKSCSHDAFHSPEMIHGYSAEDDHSDHTNVEADVDMHEIDVKARHDAMQESVVLLQGSQFRMETDMIEVHTCQSHEGNHVVDDQKAEEQLLNIVALDRDNQDSTAVWDSSGFVHELLFDIDDTTGTEG